MGITNDRGVKGSRSRSGDSLKDSTRGFNPCRGRRRAPVSGPYKSCKNLAQFIAEQQSIWIRQRFDSARMQYCAYHTFLSELGDDRIHQLDAPQHSEIETEAIE